MNRFRMIPVAAVFFACLGVLFPSTTSARIKDTTVNCPEGKATKMTLNNMVGWGCTQGLGVTKPRHGPGSNPADWGMCGVLKIAADFGPETVARIVVESNGEYTVQVFNNTASDVPTLEATCVLFTDFKGLPPIGDENSTGPFSFNGGSGVDGIFAADHAISGSNGSACIWAGLFGNLEVFNNNGTGGGTDGAFGTAGAQYFRPGSSLVSLNATTYAFCNGYTSWSWHFLAHGGTFFGPPATGASIGVNQSDSWCYMQGIEADLLYPTYGFGPMSAGIKVSGSGEYSIAATASPSGSPPGGAGISYNCLALSQ